MEAEGNPNAVGSSSISADGRLIAFASLARDLVPDDTNDTWDVFLKDRESGALTRISTAPEGEQSANGTYGATLSADGRYAAYETGGRLVVKDLEDGDVVLPARDTEGQEVLVSAWSFAASGRFIAFATSSDTLVPGDAANTIDVFVRDLQTDELTLVSVAADGSPVQGNSFAPSISADGRYVAFASWARNIVPDAPPSGTHVYVRDLQNGTTVIVDAPRDGSDPTISADGRFVAFTTYETLDPPPEYRTPITQVRVAEIATGEVVLASSAADGARGNAGSREPTLSADGRYVTFESAASNLLPEWDSNGNASDVFRKDLLTGAIEPVSISPEGVQTGGRSASMTPDGRFVSFAVGPDPGRQILVGDLGGADLTLVQRGGAGDDDLRGGEDIDLLYGNAGNDALTGLPGGDRLDSGPGDDLLQGGAGNDRLLGGAGLDTAAYADQRARYVIAIEPDGTATVLDLRPGGIDEGKDTLEGVELLRFADQTIDLRDGPPPPPEGYVIYPEAGRLDPIELGTMPDVTGDGLPELLLTSPGRIGLSEPGHLYLAFGTADGVIDLRRVAQGEGGMMIAGGLVVGFGQVNGITASIIGDLNDDGLPDLLLRDPGYFLWQTSPGVGPSFDHIGSRYTIAYTSAEGGVRSTEGLQAGSGGIWVATIGQTIRPDFPPVTRAIGPVPPDTLSVTPLADPYGHPDGLVLLRGPTGRAPDWRTVDILYSDLPPTAGPVGPERRGTNGVSAVPDIDGDDRPELLVGGRQVDPQSPLSTSVPNASYLVFSGSGGEASILGFSNTPRGWLPDENDDGLPELLLRGSDGRDFVVFGRTGEPVIQLSDVEQGIGGYVLGSGSDLL